MPKNKDPKAKFLARQNRAQNDPKVLQEQARKKNKVERAKFEAQKKRDHETAQMSKMVRESLIPANVSMSVEGREVATGTAVEATQE